MASGVTLGTSVGWSDVYPPGYPEQWIDVTGLGAVFRLPAHRRPGNGIYESNERNNSATTVVRLPFRVRSPDLPRRPRRGRGPAPGQPVLLLSPVTTVRGVVRMV